MLPVLVNYFRIVRLVLRGLVVQSFELRTFSFDLYYILVDLHEKKNEK